MQILKSLEKMLFWGLKTLEKMENKKIALELNNRVEEITRKNRAGIIKKLTQFVIDDQYYKTGLLLTEKQARKIAAMHFNTAKAAGVLDEMNNFIK